MAIVDADLEDLFLSTVGSRFVVRIFLEISVVNAVGPTMRPRLC